MKTIITALCLFLLASCASIPKLAKDIALARDGIMSLVPDSFVGDADLSRHDMYFDIVLKAGNLHKNSSGQWSWDWIDYERKTHIPVAGFSWQSDVVVKLGKVP